VVKKELITTLKTKQLRIKDLKVKDKLPKEIKRTKTPHKELNKVITNLKVDKERNKNSFQFKPTSALQVPELKMIEKIVLPSTAIIVKKEETLEEITEDKEVSETTTEVTTETLNLVTMQTLPLKEVMNKEDLDPTDHQEITTTEEITKMVETLVTTEDKEVLETTKMVETLETIEDKEVSETTETGTITKKEETLATTEDKEVSETTVTTKMVETLVITEDPETTTEITTEKDFLTTLAIKDP